MKHNEHDGVTEQARWTIALLLRTPLHLVPTPMRGNEVGDNPRCY